MLIDPPILEIQLFQNLTFEIQGQDHEWGQNSKWIRLPIDFTSFSLHVNRSSQSWDTAYWKFWLWKSKVKVIAEHHIVGPTSYWFTSPLFHVNGPSHSWNTAFQNLTIKSQGQGHGRGQSTKPQSVSHFLLIHIPFIPCQSALLFLWYCFFNIWPWNSQSHKPMMVHNYRFRQFHRTWNGVNLSSSFRDMCLAKSGPQGYLVWQVFGPLASPCGVHGQITMALHNHRSRQFHRTSNGVNLSSAFGDLDPTDARFDKFLAHGQAHMEQMGKWP